MLLQNWSKNFATFLTSFLVNCCGSVFLFFFFRPSFRWIIFLIPSLSLYNNLSLLDFRSHSLSFSFSVTPSLFICLFISHHLDHSFSHAHATPHPLPLPPQHTAVTSLPPLIFPICRDSTYWPYAWTCPNPGTSKLPMPCRYVRTDITVHLYALI